MEQASQLNNNASAATSKSQPIVRWWLAQALAKHNAMLLDQQLLRGAMPSPTVGVPDHG